MKATELITELQKIIEAHGDLPVFTTYTDRYGDLDELEIDKEDLKINEKSILEMGNPKRITINS